MLEAVEEAGLGRRVVSPRLRRRGQARSARRSATEGKIYIESQGWCVLGGAGADDAEGPSRGRARKAMESVHRLLYTPKGVLIQQPAYSTYHVELGEVSSYPPGVKENAGIFSHNNTWIHLAWCHLGEGDRALEYYLSICPSAKQGEIDLYRSEPYVYAQMIAGRDAPCFGEAKNSWLTGTAAWTLVALTQGILGIKPDYEGLIVDPCIARAWKGYLRDAQIPRGGVPHRGEESQGDLQRRRFGQGGRQGPRPRRQNGPPSDLPRGHDSPRRD